MPLLKVGAKIPAFLMKDSTGQAFGSSDLKGRYCVIYFYPRDDTPGCTMEACEFRDLSKTFDKLDVEIFGVSSDTADSHKKFSDKFSLNFRLIVDTPDKLGRSPFAMKLGVWQRKIMYGKTYMGVVRTTFLIAPNGTVAQRWDKVKPEGHAKEVAQLIADLKKGVKATKRAETKVVAPAKKSKVVKK